MPMMLQRSPAGLGLARVLLRVTLSVPGEARTGTVLLTVRGELTSHLG
jgi:hypothetical protein